LSAAPCNAAKTPTMAAPFDTSQADGTNRQPGVGHARGTAEQAGTGQARGTTEWPGTAEAAYAPGVAPAAHAPGAAEAASRPEPGATACGDMASGTAGPTRATTGPVRGGVELTVPLSTLMGLTELPGELAGWGPVIADIARQVAEQQRRGRWRFTVHDGNTLYTGVTRRRPTADLADYISARDRTCRAPGCRVPAHRADIDHIRDWAHGGPTEERNLGTLCRHDHGLKHHGHWEYHQIAPGVFQRRTALGHTYLVPPEPRPEG
ncbi:HNH endonuclease signature motif containing protein, partial [Phytohabitans aurantiacus]|uniref:HNH endonuclease signature motif containing protein n=1 Tax=Phytohabitans aurantiacus TaxID=3016789 RepID=UPI0024924A67